MPSKRKTVFLVGDGMGDYPVDALGGRTPLQAARIPHIRALAAAGRVVQVKTVPPGMQAGSDIANLSLLGYDASRSYTGRAPIEAAGAGIALGPDDVAFRCNLVTVHDGRMDDHSAGHIGNEEGAELLAAVQERFGREGLRFYPGVGYRHLLIWKNGPEGITAAPPHDIAGRPVADYPPSGPGAEEVLALMEESRDLLARHPVNAARLRAGRKPATQIWLWGQGRSMRLETFGERFGLSGGVVSAVDLVRGLGLLAGLEAPVIPGATGFLDTDFEAKVAAALDLLERGDFVYVHIEAPDECGHLGDADLKVRAIELFDERVVGPMRRALDAAGRPYRLLVGTDHRTPVSLRGHTDEPVPLLAYEGPAPEADGEAPFDECTGGPCAGMAFDLIKEWLENP